VSDFPDCYDYVSISAYLLSGIRQEKVSLTWVSVDLITNNPTADMAIFIFAQNLLISWSIQFKIGILFSNMDLYSGLVLFDQVLGFPVPETAIAAVAFITQRTCLFF
jgi:hypothetical protein